MDTYSSGEDLVIKTRKPYTITKQRERWTEEEHNRFLEALKLYGRAWQRIEEHIGTKTAVQIRSHAQKFFSKLEKEALVKGVPMGQNLDIDIPPPRPKRKPSNPYPRKISAAIPTSHVGVKDVKLFPSESSSHCKQVLDLEKEPLPERPGGEENPTNEKENQDENCSEVFTMLQEAHCSISSANRNSMPSPVALRNACAFKEFVPSIRRANQDETNGSYVTIEHHGNQNLEKVKAKQTEVLDNGTSRVSKLDNSNSPLKKLVQNEKRNDLNCEMPAEDMQTTQNYPRHVPVHVLDGSVVTCTQTPADISFQDPIFHPMGEVPGHHTLFPNPAASAITEHQSSVSRSSVHQSFPPFHPTFTPICHDQDESRSFLQISSTFSSLIISTLLQNPAAHAAASFAATFWPYANMETSADSPACPQGGFLSTQMNSTPSMAAIAGATVAAATAWWAAHGLLPFCAPLHTGFANAPASTSGVPSMDMGQAPAAKTERGEKSPNFPLQDQLDPEHSEALQPRHAASKSPIRSSSESEESGAAKSNNCFKAADNEKAIAEPELHDSNKVESRKQVDRSSCGSNTASSSEVETDALEKHDKGKEELNESDNNDPATESINRRCRSSSMSSESWKAVSEEGRLAFQALFSREVLPQSFSPQYDLNKEEHQNNSAKGDKQNVEEKGGDTSLLDLNRRICMQPKGTGDRSLFLSCSIHQELEKNASSRRDTNGDKGLLTIGLGHGKLKTRRTGFKPYKRCSVEAKEIRVGSASCHGEEKSPKRLCLEREAST